MNKYLVIMVLLLLSASTSCEEKGQAQDDKQINNMNKPQELFDQFSYIIGNNWGANFKKDSIYNVNYDYLIRGIKDVIENKEPLLSRSSMDSIMDIVQKILSERNYRKTINEKKSAEDNKKEAFDFLQENKKKKGVVTLENGIQYEILLSGQGKKPIINDFVKMDIIAKVLNGEEFDNSYARGEPVIIKLIPEMLKAWVEILPLMKIGSKWRVYSPPEFALGDTGTDKVPANKLVIFEIELLDVSKEQFDKDNPIMVPNLEEQQ